MAADDAKEPTPPDVDTVIKVRDLHKRLGGQVIHDGLDLDVHRGEVLSVIGSSGSGKTTLLQQVIGLRAPDRGSIHVLGKDINDLEHWQAHVLRRRWGVLFQQAALFSALSVYDNLAFPIRELRTEGVKVDEDMLREGIALKLHMVGLDPDVARKYPWELSGGMAKRVALARALMLEAELLFLDEPTNGLDPASSSEFDELLRALCKDLGLTMLMITHDIYSVVTLSDRVAVLADGKLATVDSLDAVAATEHPFITDFFHPRLGAERLQALTEKQA